MNLDKKVVLVSVIALLVLITTMFVGVWTGKMPMEVQSILVVIIAILTVVAFSGSGNDKKRPADPTCPNCHWSVLRTMKHCPECGQSLLKK